MGTFGNIISRRASDGALRIVGGQANIEIAPAANTVFTQGNVGIGTTNPGASLQTGNNFTNLNGRVLTSNAVGWAADGQTPSVVISNSTAATTYASMIGLDLHNDGTTVNSYSPFIMFSRRGPSTAYNAAFAGIGAQATGTGVDTNWVAGDLVFTTTVAGGYQTEKMRIQGNGNVGIGTVSPGYTLDINGTTNASTLAVNQAKLYLAGVGDTNHYIEMNNTIAGNTMRIHEVGNILLDSPTTNVGLGALSGRRLDVSANTGDGLAIGQDTDNSQTIQAYIDGQWAARATYAGGCCNGLKLQPDVGYVTIGPSWIVDHSGNMSGVGTISSGAITASGAVRISAGGTSLSVAADICSDVYGCASTRSLSDARLKTNINPLGSALAKVMQLKPITYNWNDIFHSLYPQLLNASSTELGFVAQDVQPLFPEIVTQQPTGYLSINYEKMVPVLAEAIQEQQGQFEALIGSTTASTTPEAQSFAASFFSNLFSRITSWLADASNGIKELYASVIRAGEVHSKKLCAETSGGGEVCVTGDQLAALLAGQTASAATTVVDTQSNPTGQTSTSTTTTSASTTPAADTTAPTLTLHGENPTTIQTGMTYADQGATATDNHDTVLYIYAQVDQGPTIQPGDMVTLDTTQAGDHTVTFTVTDEAGNTSTSTRTVHVVMPEAPVPDPATDAASSTTQ